MKIEFAKGHQDDSDQNEILTETDNLTELIQVPIKQVPEELPETNTNSKLMLRVLTINYLIHVIAFSFAAWMSK